ncbi:MAG: nucleotidyl transferase AbiEii/AbiGii toxin family protein [Acidobacteriota bacterium]
MRESLPLSKIQRAILEFLQGREDVVLFGAQAVNAYVSEPRMTQNVDLLSFRADKLAEELRDFLGEKFHIAVRIREVADGKGFRIYQIRSEGNRHLVDLRMVTELPATEKIEDILVLSPIELIASKVISYHSRKGKPKAGTDYRDLGMLLLRFPELREKVFENLRVKNVNTAILETWNEIEHQDFQTEDEDQD